MSDKIAHLELATTDKAASAKFYAALFGWPIETVQPMDYTVTMFPPGETTMGLAPVKETQGIMAGSVLPGPCGRRRHRCLYRTCQGIGRADFPGQDGNPRRRLDGNRWRPGRQPHGSHATDGAAQRVVGYSRPQKARHSMTKKTSGLGKPGGFSHRSRKSQRWPPPSQLYLHISARGCDGRLISALVPGTLSWYASP